MVEIFTFYFFNFYFLFLIKFFFTFFFNQWLKLIVTFCNYQFQPLKVITSDPNLPHILALNKYWVIKTERVRLLICPSINDRQAPVVKISIIIQLLFNGNTLSGVNISII